MRHYVIYTFVKRVLSDSSFDMAGGMDTATVLLSGGLDSTVLLHYVVKDLGYGQVFALSFRYGQKHSRELEMAAWQARYLAGVAEHQVIDLPFFSTLAAGSSALLEGGAEVPALKAVPLDALDQPPTYVPNRNMILLSLAAAYGEARGCHTVFYGAQAQDEYGYWDCTAEFVTRVNRVLSLNRRSPVTIQAPFAGQRKSEGIRLGVRLGVDFAHTWSCYRGEERPCGACPTCVERRQAFAEVGIGDPWFG